MLGNLIDYNISPAFVLTGFPHVLENLENYKLNFQVLEFCKIRKCHGKILPVKKFT